MSEVPDTTTAAVLSGSEPLPEGMPIVRGYDFSEPSVDYEKLLQSYATSGFQASHFGQAVEIINSMVRYFSIVLHSDTCLYFQHC